MKINQIQKTLFFILLTSINFSFSQEINNNLQGYYVSKSPDAMYSSFEFDGNGKVSIIIFYVLLMYLITYIKSPPGHNMWQ